jgi:hypothetical protein
VLGLQGSCQAATFVLKRLCCSMVRVAASQLLTSSDARRTLIAQAAAQQLSYQKQLHSSSRVSPEAALQLSFHKQLHSSSCRAAAECSLVGVCRLSSAMLLAGAQHRLSSHRVAVQPCWLCGGWPAMAFTSVAAQHIWKLVAGSS